MPDTQKLPTRTDYKVGWIRSQGFEARWTKTRLGAPIIVARQPGKTTWWAVTASMWAKAQQKGFPAAFESFTLLGDVFSIPT